MQQGGSRDGVETSRNAELVQRRNNRKVAGGKRKAKRTPAGMQKERAIVQEHQSRKEGSHNNY